MTSEELDEKNRNVSFAPDDGVSKRLVWCLLVLFGVLTCVLVVPLWNWTYWDFGDGNYMYIGRRMNQGLVPYRDILAPQPPLHLLFSAWSQKFGDLILGSDFLGVRLYNLIVRLAGIYVIYWAGRTWFRSETHGLAAAFIYMLLPIGFWWSICLQSENIEIVFLMIAFVGVFRMDRNSLLWAGVASGLAMHINMTALPYFLSNFVFLAARRPKLVGWYLLTTLPVWLGGAGLAYLWAGEYYLDNVLFNQVGSFPREEIISVGRPEHMKLFGSASLHYVLIEKIWMQLLEVWRLEKFPIILGFLALATRWKSTASKAWKEGRSRLANNGNVNPTFWQKYLEVNRDDQYRRFEYAAWYCIGMLLSICFTAKGGTVNYIFVLGEPAVALLAADGIVRFLRHTIRKQQHGQFMILPKPNHIIYASIGCAFLIMMSTSSMVNLFQTFGSRSEPLQRELQIRIPVGDNKYKFSSFFQVELVEYKVREVSELIEAFTEEGDPILAPPFYAYATNRTVAAEFAESYLWSIKYRNEEYDRKNGLRMEMGGAQEKALELTRMIRNKEIPLIIFDNRTTANVDILHPAIARHYEQVIVDGEPLFVVTRHKNMPVYVPRAEE